MSSNISDEVMEKLGKILRLANDKAATEGEVQAAMLQAKRLAEKYQIDLAMVSLENPDEKKDLSGIKVVKENIRARSATIQIYHQAIWHMFSEVFGVRTIYFSKRSPNMIFVGETTDLMVCKALFPWLEQVYYRIYNDGAKEGIYHRNAASKRGAYYGITQGIIQANKKKEKRSEKEEQCLGLVVRKKEDLIDKAMENVRAVKNRSTDMDPDAYFHGKEQGRKIKLDQLGAPK